jgi:hypothetical protein
MFCFLATNLFYILFRFVLRILYQHIFCLGLCEWYAVGVEAMLKNKYVLLYITVKKYLLKFGRIFWLIELFYFDYKNVTFLSMNIDCKQTLINSSYAIHKLVPNNFLYYCWWIHYKLNNLIRIYQFDIWLDLTLADICPKGMVNIGWCSLWR